MTYDILPEKYTLHAPRQFEIQYKKEAVPGESLKLCYYEISDGIMVSGLFGDDESSFIVKILF